MIAEAVRDEWQVSTPTYEVEPARGASRHKVVNGDEITGDRLPELREIELVIEESRYVLESSEDEDADLPASEETWKRSADFLRRLAHNVWSRSNMVIDVPEITLGPGKSIDMYWVGKTRKLLVNIPADKGEKAAYYGDDCYGDTAKGRINTERGNLKLLLALLGAWA